MASAKSKGKQPDRGGRKRGRDRDDDSDHDNDRSARDLQRLAQSTGLKKKGGHRKKKKARHNDSSSDGNSDSSDSDDSGSDEEEEGDYDDDTSQRKRKRKSGGNATQMAKLLGKLQSTRITSILVNTDRSTAQNETLMAEVTRMRAQIDQQDRHTATGAVETPGASGSGTRQTSAATARNDATPLPEALIPKPPKLDTVNILELREQMGIADNSARWRHMRATIRDLISRAGLDIGLTWTEQDKTAVGKAQKRLPELQRFKFNWAGEYLVKEAFNHRRTHQRALDKEGAAAEIEPDDPPSSGNNTPRSNSPDDAENAAGSNSPRPPRTPAPAASNAGQLSAAAEKAAKAKKAAAAAKAAKAAKAAAAAAAVLSSATAPNSSEPRVAADPPVSHATPPRPSPSRSPTPPRPSSPRGPNPAQPHTPAPTSAAARRTPSAELPRPSVSPTHASGGSPNHSATGAPGANATQAAASGSGSRQSGDTNKPRRGRNTVAMPASSRQTRSATTAAATATDGDARSTNASSSKKKVRPAVKGTSKK
ncbi:hypothetical protein FRC09_004535 [Ceratobasidium sp. 395]|nr:hypothetical protein FRC09_004535 [Ceratobasidium sp. 395]